MSGLAQASCQLTRVRNANSRSAKGWPRNRTKYAYDANGNATSRQGSSITWASYNYPTSISAGSGSTAETVTLSYGPDRQRWQQYYTGNSTTETTDYVGQQMEVVVSGGVTDFRHYIYGGSGVVAVYSRKSNGTNTFSYLLSDHQASVASTTNSSGGVVVAESFTPFGSRRNPTTWSGPDTTSDLTTIAGITREGYTFQTALGLWMGMNHMNGRVEDAVTGRMLSADFVIPDPTNTQSYNRYSYVNNNPLSLVDPTGFDECGNDSASANSGDYSGDSADDGSGGGDGGGDDASHNVEYNYAPRASAKDGCVTITASRDPGRGGVEVNIDRNPGGPPEGGGDGGGGVPTRTVKPQGNHPFCIPNTVVQGIAGAAGGAVGGAIPGLLAGQPELAIAGAVVGGVAGGVVGALSAQPASTPGMVAAGAAAMGGAIPNPGYGRATTGIAGAYIGYGVTTSLQANGYGPGLSNVVGGAVGGSIGGAGAAALAGEAIGGATGIGALAGAAGAATAVGVTTGLNFLNNLLGCGGGG